MPLSRSDNAARQHIRRKSSVALATASPKIGFYKREYGLRWFNTKDSLMEANPGNVLIGTSYEYRTTRKAGGTKQAKKYSSFQNHEEYWKYVEAANRTGTCHNLHEIFPETRPRCLYFDLDGPVEYKEFHDVIIEILRSYVRWFFSADTFDWKPEALTPVVLTTCDPNKYSAHIIFPEVQFRNYEHQQQYVPQLLSALRTVLIDFGTESIPILEKLVDPIPYTKFQLFRGPFACKLKEGTLLPNTRLEPDNYFRDDPLASFAGHTDFDYALQLPTMDQLLSVNEELRSLIGERRARMRAAGVNCKGPWGQDEALLYHADFEMPGGGEIDFAGYTEVEQFEEGLQLLHPERAKQYWSWFRISGVTYSLLRSYQFDQKSRERIMNAHMHWSREYEQFDHCENVDYIKKCEGRPVSGINLILRLVRHDNPGMRFRDALERKCLLTPTRKRSQAKWVTNTRLNA